MWKLTYLYPWSAAPGCSRSGRAIQTNPGRWPPPSVTLGLSPLSWPNIYWKRGSSLWPKVGHISESSLFVNDFLAGPGTLTREVVGNSFMVGSSLPLCRQGAICVCSEHTSPGMKNTQAVCRLLLQQLLCLTGCSALF